MLCLVSFSYHFRNVLILVDYSSKSNGGAVSNVIFGLPRVEGVPVIVIHHINTCLDRSRRPSQRQ
jgi:hypothetical protein